VGQKGSNVEFGASWGWERSGPRDRPKPPWCLHAGWRSNRERRRKKAGPEGEEATQEGTKEGGGEALASDTKDEA